MNIVKIRICCMALLLLGGAAQAQAASETVSLRIEPRSMKSALTQFGEQTGLQIMFSKEAVEDLKSPGLVGSFAPETALAHLIAKTGLRYEFVNARTVRIWNDSNDLQSEVTSDRGNDAVTVALAEASSAQNEGLDSGIASDKSTADSGSGAKKYAVEEIIVTAQKREERLGDVPAPVSVINAQQLTQNNQLRLQDYFTKLPGVNLTTSNYGPPIVSMRGITSGGLGVNPTVAIVVDDVPLGPSMREAFGPEIPEMDPSDLARIEVLRGPQGTLYGASSMGGLVKYVTIDPSTAGLSGQAQAGVSSVNNGDGLGYTLRGAINIPLAESFALRAGGFKRRDAGYIDDPIHNLDGVNWGESSGGQLSALWKPNERWSLKLGAMIQDTQRHGSSEVNIQAGLGDLQQNKIPGSGENRKELEIYDAVLNAKLGAIDLTSVTGYSVTTKFTSADDTASAFLSGVAQGAFGGVGGVEFQNDLNVNKFSEEVRLSSRIGERIEWLAGGYYSHESISLAQDWLVKNFNTGTLAGSMFHADNPLDYEEYAGFAALTYHFTDRFDVQFGARQAWTRKSLAKTQSGVYVRDRLGGVTNLPETVSKEDSFTYLITPRFRISSELMAYARLASGYRPGGPNLNCIVLNQPCQYDPDTTRNYEIGLKANAFDRRLTFDASLYYIDWNDIQILVLDPLVSASVYSTNGGRAKSQGAEASIEARPWSGGTISGSFSFNDAVLTEAFPPAALRLSYGVSGTRLPFSSRFSGNISLNQEIALANDMIGFVGGSLSYVGDRYSSFAASAVAVRQRFPAYTQLDLSAGIRLNTWVANVYLNNVSDRRGMLFGGVGNFDPTSFSYIQPRTAGLSLVKTF